VIFTRFVNNIFFDFKTFIRTDSPVGFFWQAKNLGRVGLEIYPYLVLRNFLFVLPKTISVSVWGLFIYKFFQFTYLKKRKATEYISLSFILIYVLYVSQFERQADHYCRGYPVSEGVACTCGHGHPMPRNKGP